MNDHPRLPRLLPLIATTLWFAGFAPTGSPPIIARAQDMIIPLDDDEADPNAQPQQVFMMNDANFNQWVFGGRNVTTIRDRFTSLLSLKVDELDHACGLTAGQKKKLELAGRGDVKRFFDLVEEKRRKFTQGKQDQNAFNQLWQEIAPLQTFMRSEPFDDGTFFAKTLKTTLDGSQAQKYDKVLLEKRTFRYRAKLLLVVAQLDQAVGFKAEQRERLLKILQEETQPPLKFGQYDYTVIMLQVSRIPEARLKAIFNDRQWLLLKRKLDQSRGMDQFLVNAGILPDAKPRGDKKPDPAQPQGTTTTTTTIIEK